GRDFEIEKPRPSDRWRWRKLYCAPFGGNGLRHFLRFLACRLGNGQRAIGLEFAKIGAIGTAHIGVLWIEPKLGEHGCVRGGELAGEVFHGMRNGMWG